MKMKMKGCEGKKHERKEKEAMKQAMKPKKKK